jgi:anti-anti-sigma factor
VAGELDYDSAPQLRTALEQVPMSPRAGLVIDLAGVTFCDSSGLSVLIAARNLTESAGTSLVLAARPPQLRRILQVTGLADIFSLFASLEEAERTLCDSYGLSS